MPGSLLTETRLPGGSRAQVGQDREPGGAVGHRLAAGVTDLVPGGLDQLDHRRRQGHVVEIDRELLAAVQSPLEELQRFGGTLRIRGRTIHQDEARRGNGPGIRPGLIVQVDPEARLGLPVDAVGGRREGQVVGLHGLAVAIDHGGVGHLVLLGVRVLDVADRTVDLGDIRRHTGIAPSAETGRPVDGLARPRGGLESRRHLREVVGEHIGGAGGIRAVHQGDRGGRQLHAGVDLRDGRIVPGLDLAPEDVGQHRAGELHLARLDAGQIDHGHHAADHRRELHQTALGEFLAAQRVIGGAEIDGLGLDLLDATARADGLVVERDARGRLVGFGPLGVDGGRKGGTGAGDLRLGGTDGHQADGSDEETKQHGTPRCRTSGQCVRCA